MPGTRVRPSAGPSTSLVPGIHAFLRRKQDVDGRDEPGHDGIERTGGPMRCPSCGSLDTQVKDSRPTEDSAVIRRRRVCLTCNFRFTTFERVQLRELTVIKRNGRRVPFDRDKLVRSVQVALRKRAVDPERIEQEVSKIVRELESQGENEVTSETIGELVMEHLRELDDVAYVRFASVYRNFREAKDFRAALDELSGDEGGKPAATARK
jgi:transcriptional repressor NrdR